MNESEPSFQAYYLGLSDSGGRSFRSDILQVVPPRLRYGTPPGAEGGMLGLDAFWQGGRADFITGRHRTQFLVACFFTVLIDQVVHSHFRPLHPKFEALTAPPKLCTTINNIHPGAILDSKHLRGDADPESVFNEAKALFEMQLGQFARQHLPEMSATRVWEVVRQYLPPTGEAFSRSSF